MYYFLEFSLLNKKKKKVYDKTVLIDINTRPIIKSLKDATRGIKVVIEPSTKPKTMK